MCRPPPLRVCLAACIDQSSELTPSAEAAFTEIFSRYSSNAGMDIRDMVSAGGGRRVVPPHFVGDCKRDILGDLMD